MILAVGEPAQGGVQVLEINVATATVKIDNSGTIQTLDLEKNAPKAAAAPPPGVMPVPTGNPRSGLPMPVPAPAAAAAPNSITAIGRPLRGQNPAGSSSSSILGAGPSGLPSPAAQAAAAAAAKQLTAEEQIVMMEVERERTKDKVAAGLMPPLPPTALTPPGSAGMPTPPTPQAPLTQ